MTKTKPSRQEMIDAIYEKIADKTLSFGCKMKSKSYNGVLISIEGGDNANIMNVDYYNSISFEDINDFEIIGHPVMIGDVMDYFDFHIFDHGSYGYEVKTDFYHINGVWKNKRKPIEDQSDECIDFIYNLIS